MIGSKSIATPKYTIFTSLRNDKEVLKEIKIWGLTSPNVRTVILTSSRANPNGHVDLFSDYDIEVVVRNREQFLNNEEWLSAFGEILALIQEDNDDFSMRLILYKDYVRIDFKIYELTYFQKHRGQIEFLGNWDNGYNILVDKDGISSSFASPGYTAFIIKQPTTDEFLSVVNDFWWDITYVAKSLWRDEIYYAKFMLDNIIRFSYLQKMIEWNIGLQHNWQITTNKHGRFFKQYLDTETWAKLKTTFAGSEIEENWNALFATMQLFRQLAMTIATELNYCYPQKTDIEITEYLKKIKALDKNALDIE